MNESDDATSDVLRELMRRFERMDADRRPYPAFEEYSVDQILLAVQELVSEAARRMAVSIAQTTAEALGPAGVVVRDRDSARPLRGPLQFASVLGDGSSSAQDFTAPRRR
jgi:hypothetical protein